MTKRDDVVEAARSYVGVRFRHMGRDRSGLDCIGLLLRAGADCGIELLDSPADYKRTPDVELFKEMIRTQSVPGSVEHLRHGSIVMLRQSVYPCHCGIIASNCTNRSLIHASTKLRAVAEEPLTSFLSLIIEVREFKGI